MSPQALRYPSPASEAQAGGRHRRPESLAGTGRPEMPAEDTRPARHSFGAEGRIAVPVERRGTASGEWRIAVPAQRTSRHQRTAGGPTRTPTATRTPGRHTASHRAGGARPPVTGSHRAPGTLPIESWLLMGKTRQQVLLASLVAVGLMLVALPNDRGAQDQVDAVNAAAQRAAEAQSASKNRDKDKQTGGEQTGGREGGAPAPAPSATAPLPAVPPVTQPEAEGKAGPGNSLRTTGTRAVALTFDDGPDPVQTPRILALLARYNVKATFCVVGAQAQRHPDVLRQIVTAGHTLCNHTWDHSLTIGKDNPGQIRADLNRTHAAIQAAAPGVEVPFFRAPGGNFTNRLVDVAASQGMISLYWEVDPRDWERPEGETGRQHVARIVNDVRSQVRPGSIVLSHDFNQPDTITAYEKLLPWLVANFTLGIPGEPVPDETPDNPQPTPSESAPDTPEPSGSATPAPPAKAPDAGTAAAGSKAPQAG
ncbi:polysaccharide deacetylase family protein [Paractinoplanes rishiriensis]|uniref:NodB homology domain-containing protein n=1 Tax=Paractinoplanes rishiriensis TaxID=1050105 RepID=A0A919MSQ7_9ACTN|nr:polysaccharide deacetylase family protein [Actinoplanes rishiriensis]GIE93968.1 hypothetical protein Ari01nite_14330 [Actinoplanes rishiriensis]